MLPYPMEIHMDLGSTLNRVCSVFGALINPTRSLGAAIIYNKERAWDDRWIFWVGLFIGAALAALYHQIVIRAIPFKTRA
ncbi:hypothetical protein TIFTF001_014125 [Ficus carica]|uniref:Uncharacterized protein n=1 Tax=Ficus carica TaxID=3494 RepID=A0AA88D5B8_FICCA|nr:hypothetical protein TIFTF001_014125 [Ficus carica]